MISESVTWKQAEEIFPGVRADWDWMLINGCGPWAAGPDPEKPVRLEIHMYEGKRSLHVIEEDLVEKWHYPPTWIRSADGNWNSPIPLTKALHDSALWFKR